MTWLKRSVGRGRSKTKKQLNGEESEDAGERIIPCLDVQDGMVVKGIHFEGIREVGDPVECAVAYDRQGADEICFLDITATHEGRGTMVDVVRRTAKKVFVPLTVGGGVRTIDDYRQILRAGADKVSVNSAAIRNPELIRAGGGQIRKPVRSGSGGRKTPC